jgi:hypothetical protein
MVLGAGDIITTLNFNFELPDICSENLSVGTGLRTGELVNFKKHKKTQKYKKLELTKFSKSI